MTEVPTYLTLPKVPKYLQQQYISKHGRVPAYRRYLTQAMGWNMTWNIAHFTVRITSPSRKSLRLGPAKPAETGIDHDSLNRSSPELHYLA